METINAGKRVNLQEIQRGNGYTAKSAKAMKATQTKTYKDAMTPFASRLQKEISKIQLEMAKRSISDEDYRDLAEVLDKLNKNLQLATGGATENVHLTELDELRISIKNMIDGNKPA
jgi:two-component sensor histidine kinase